MDRKWLKNHHRNSTKQILILRKLENILSTNKTGKLWSKMWFSCKSYHASWKDKGKYWNICLHNLFLNFIQNKKIKTVHLLFQNVFKELIQQHWSTSVNATYKIPKATKDEFYTKHLAYLNQYLQMDKVKVIIITSLYSWLPDGICHFFI